MDIIIVPAKAKIVPRREIPPELPAFLILKSKRDKHLLLNTGPSSLAHVSAVTVAIRTIYRYMKVSFFVIMYAAEEITAKNILAKTCHMFLLLDLRDL